MHIRLGGSELYYVRHGRGLPLLMLHGGPGLSHAYFRPFVDALGDCAELIYYDHRGNGRSVDPAKSAGQRDDVAACTVESWADDAEALRQALKLGPCAVLGHGFGGLVAQTYARRHPGALRGLVLCNTYPALDYPAQMLARARDYGSDDAVAALLGCVATPSKDDAALRALWRRSLPRYFYRYQPMVVSAIADGIAYSAAAYNRGLFELVPHFDSQPWLHELDVPTLVVAGAHDWMAPPKEATARLAAGLPRAQVHTLEHSGHYPFVEEPTRFCHAVRTFLRQLDAG